MAWYRVLAWTTVAEETPGLTAIYKWNNKYKLI